MPLYRCVVSAEPEWEVEPSAPEREKEVRLEVAYELSAPSREALEEWLQARGIRISAIEELEPCPA